MSAKFTLAAAAWRTPDGWGDFPTFHTWEQIRDIAEILGADPREAHQYLLVGTNQRGVPRGWYRHATFGTADGKTTWSIHCAELGQDLIVLRDAYTRMEKPAFITEESEREALMRCLRKAR